MYNFKKVGIIGIGAIGSFLCGLFNKSGFEVYPFEKNKDIKYNLEKRGILISGEKKIKIEPFKVYDNFKKFNFNGLDFLIISVKAYDLESLFKEIPLNSIKIPVIFVQNGLGIENLFKKKKIFFRLVSHIAVFRKENEKIIFKNLNKINYLGGDDIECGKAISKTFCKIGLNTIFKKDIKRFVWEKAILNAILNPLSAIFEKNMEDTLRIKGIDLIIKNLIKESVLVSEKDGVVFNKNFEKLALNYIRRGGKHIPSMVMDKKSNGKTEIDFLNGKISELGKKYKIKTPINDLVCSLLINKFNERNL